MNELLLRLLPREGRPPVLFDAYDAALAAAGRRRSRAAGALRRFEWVLLRETGYGVDEAEPDFDDPAVGLSCAAALRERLEANLAPARPLATP